MTSVVDFHQSIIALGEKRNLEDYRVTGVCKKPITKAQSVVNHAITEEAFELLSLVASGITTTKPKDHVIVDIDEFDKNNELAQVEYVEEIYMFYKLSETRGCFKDYMDSQPHINARMRARLLDWLIQVHGNCGFMPETLYLTINIVDRYLSVTTIARTELQLVGIGVLLISSKYEEILALPVDYMITVLDTGYSREEMLAMEMAILSRLDWYLSVPTPYFFFLNSNFIKTSQGLENKKKSVFTVRYTKASLPYDKEMEDMVFFFTELGLLDYKVTQRSNPSKLAASAVYAARCTLNKTPAWTETLKHHTGYSEDQLRDCAKRLVYRHARASENKLKAVYKKYGHPDRSAVSLCPPATSMLAENRHK